MKEDRGDRLLPDGAVLGAVPELFGDMRPVGEGSGGAPGAPVIHALGKGSLSCSLTDSESNMTVT